MRSCRLSVWWYAFLVVILVTIEGLASLSEFVKCSLSLHSKSGASTTMAVRSTC